MSSDGDRSAYRPSTDDRHPILVLVPSPIPVASLHLLSQMTQHRLTPSFRLNDGYILFMLNTLIADLRSPDPLVRVKAVPALGDLGAAAVEAIPTLLLITQDETQHSMIRVRAAAAVAKIDPSQTGAVLSVLLEALNSDDATSQGAAADELGAIGKHAEPALAALFGLLNDDRAAVQSTGAQAIRRITGERTPARQVGRALLRSRDWLDRQIEGSLLVLLGDERRR